MTTVMVVLLGIGALLIISAIECQPLVATFQSIIGNQPLDLSGTADCGGISSSVVTAPAGPGQGPILPHGA